MSEKLFNYSLDGLEFSIRVYLDGGVYKAEITVLEGHADFNALYWGDDISGNSSFSGFTGRDKALNMNGAEGSNYLGHPVEWDGAQKLSSAGLGPEGESKSTFLEAGETATFELTGLTSLDDLDYLGVRATSTSTESGSIKTISVPTEEPEPEDDFPQWAQDISNIILVFDQDAGDTKPVPGGDGYYTVKIDNWPAAADDDVDNTIDDIMAYLIANDAFILDDSNLMGVVIKGGLQETQFFAYGDYNTNGTDPDALPAGIGFTLTGGHENVQPPNAVDTSYDYDLIFV